MRASAYNTGVSKMLPDHCYFLIHLIFTLLLTGRMDANTEDNEIIGPRIIGGNVTYEGKYPSQACLKYYSSPVCGATIISNRYILTAAHCTLTEYPEYLGVTAGSLNIYEGVFHNIKNIIPHNDYDPMTSENDIEIIEVYPPFVFGPKIRAAPLPALGAKDPAVGAVATIIGWGASLQSGKAMSYLLLEAQVEIRNHTMCQEAYSVVNNEIFSSQICANDAVDHKGICSGDSGGPLFVNGVVVGVSAYVKDCEVYRYPSVFTRVSHYREWIRNITGV